MASQAGAVKQQLQVILGGVREWVITGVTDYYTSQSVHVTEGQPQRYPEQLPSDNTRLPGSSGSISPINTVGFCNIRRGGEGDLTLKPPTGCVAGHSKTLADR